MSLEGYAQRTQSVAIVHGEAFQLMLYRSEDGSQLWFWNSRDGVTPFGTTVDGKNYRHAMHGYPTRYSAVLPDEAQYVWVSYTPETWEGMQRRTYARFASAPDDKPYGGADFRERFPDLGDWLRGLPFEHGQPYELSRDDFLKTTPEWMGSASADTLPKGQAAKQGLAGTESGAVPNDSEADAQTPPTSPRKSTHDSP